MLKIGVIGLGNIAQKAYLPVMAQLQEQVSWFLCTRNATKLANLQARYHFEHGSTELTDLWQAGLTAVFIHTPTHTHYTLIRQCLAHNLHVFVDKPLAESPEQAAELYRLAAEKQLLLTVGFNRRFAPQVAQLATLPDKQVIHVTKTRTHLQQPTAFVIYDLMIHAIDTALFLADPLTNYQPRYYIQQDEQGNLLLAQLQLTTPTQLITVDLNLNSGTNQEIMSVQSLSGIHTLTNLRDLTVQTDGLTQQMTTADWQPTLVTRGFEPMIKAFVAAVDPQKPATNPVAATGSLLSHQLCQQLIDFAANQY